MTGSHDHVDHRLEHLVRRVLADIERVPVEDGASHPAEPRLAEILRGPAVAAVYGKMFEGRMNTCLAASVLRLLGRYPLEDSPTRSSILRRALAAPAVELRDAAVQAVELWGDPAANDILRGHVEAVPWLAEYIARMLRETAAAPAPESSRQ